MLEVTGLRGLGRLDFLLIDEVLYVNEVNTIPGLDGRSTCGPPTSPPPSCCSVRSRRRRGAFGRSEPAPFEPGAALRAAGGMAGKLGQIGAH